MIKIVNGQLKRCTGPVMGLWASIGCCLKIDNNKNYGGTTFLFNTRAAKPLCKIRNYILLRHLFCRDWRWEW